MSINNNRLCLVTMQLYISWCNFQGKCKVRNQDEHLKLWQSPRKTILFIQRNKTIIWNYGKCKKNVSMIFQTGIKPLSGDCSENVT